MSEISDQLAKLLEQKEDKNYDPRLEELQRSDRLIDPNNETLSKLEEQEIFHIAKIRGAQLGYSIPLWKVKKLYSTPDMLPYSTPYIDYIRKLDPSDQHDKAELESVVGGLPMTNEMIKNLIVLRHDEDAWTAKLYVDSIKPQVANQPPFMPQSQEPQEGFFSKMFGFFFGRKNDNTQYSRR